MIDSFLHVYSILSTSTGHFVGQNKGILNTIYLVHITVYTTGQAFFVDIDWLFIYSTLNKECL